MHALRAYTETAFRCHRDCKLAFGSCVHLALTTEPAAALCSTSRRTLIK